MRQQASTRAIPASGLANGQRAGSEASLVRVRPAVQADREALARMFERCSTSTRHRRFHGPVKAMPERYLAEALSGSPFHNALVACLDPQTDGAHAGGPLTGDRYTGDPYTGHPYTGEALAPGPGAADIVALASCRIVDEGAAELGLLIEDAWQRRRLGTRLLRDLVTHASRAGMRVLEAQVLAEQAWVAGMLKPYGASRLLSTWDGIMNVSVRLDQ